MLGSYSYKSSWDVLLPRPADLPLPFVYRPIDDPAPIPGTLILRIANAAGIIHAPQGQVGIPIGVRCAIVVDIRHSCCRQICYSRRRDLATAGTISPFITCDAPMPGSAAAVVIASAIRTGKTALDGFTQARIGAFTNADMEQQLGVLTLQEVSLKRELSSHGSCNQY